MAVSMSEPLAPQNYTVPFAGGGTFAVWSGTTFTWSSLASATWADALGAKTAVVAVQVN